jgi:hypothetical protein
VVLIGKFKIWQVITLGDNEKARNKERIFKQFRK